MTYTEDLALKANKTDLYEKADVADMNLKANKADVIVALSDMNDIKVNYSDLVEVFLKTD